MYDILKYQNINIVFFFNYIRLPTYSYLVFLYDFGMTSRAINVIPLNGFVCNLINSFYFFQTQFFIILYSKWVLPGKKSISDSSFQLFTFIYKLQCLYLPFNNFSPYLKVKYELQRSPCQWTKIRQSFKFQYFFLLAVSQ